MSKPLSLSTFLSLKFSDSILTIAPFNNKKPIINNHVGINI